MLAEGEEGAVHKVALGRYWADGYIGRSKWERNGRKW